MSPAVLRAATGISPWLLRKFGASKRSARMGVPVTRRTTFACLAASAVAAACALPSSQGSAQASAPAQAHAPASKHVLLISVDGMHQSDLDWYVANHPNSTLAKLTHSGSEYTNAATSNPSDSDPGGTALMTGGNPKSTGVFYDVEYSHKVDEAGAACTPGQPATGGDVIYDSPDDALASVPDLHQSRERHLPVVRRERFDLPQRRRHQPGRDHEPEVQPGDVAQLGHVPGRPEDLQADHPVGLPRRQHDLPGDPQRRPAHRLV